MNCRGGRTGSKGHLLIEKSAIKIYLSKLIWAMLDAIVWTQHDQFSGETPQKCYAL